MTDPKHIVVEGLPAVGKSEILALLERFHPRSLRILPELVKDLVTRHGLDLFRDREQLTQAIADALPEREAQIRSILAEGHLCLEESHLGVHLAYAHALGDTSFVDAYPALAEWVVEPDAYFRLRIDPEESVRRQIARGTAAFEVSVDVLTEMSTRLDRWHAAHGSSPVVIDGDRPPADVLTDVERQLGLRYGVRAEDLVETFDILLLLGRPASGKSEFIDFFTSAPAQGRAAEHHIAPFVVIDDFPILWELFEDDDLWEALDRPRLYSRKCNGNYAVTDPGLWPFLIGKINRAVAASPLMADEFRAGTLIVEFSRGGPTGYADALASLSPEILRRAAILYVSVSFEESWRRNVARYDETDRGGILTHSVPREEMEKTYGTDDWFDLATESLGMLHINGIDVPFATMPNEPESKDPAVLGPRYQRALRPLYKLWKLRA